MLGGLALGGLLGAMFFGGAFAGLNFMDILVFGGIAYLLYKLFSAKSGATRQPSYSRTAYTTEEQSYSSYKQYNDTSSGRPTSAEFDTDVLFNRDKKSRNSQEADTMDADFNEIVLPDGFDEQGFLSGAKSAFNQLQTAWDNKDLAEIRSLTTDRVFAEIQGQIKSDASENHTEVLKIEAELLNFSETGSGLEAVVLFDTIIREDLPGRAEQVREIWHFIKPKSNSLQTWYLDGIQQMDN